MVSSDYVVSMGHSGWGEKSWSATVRGVFMVWQSHFKEVLEMAVTITHNMEEWKFLTSRHNGVVVTVNHCGERISKLHEWRRRTGCEIDTSYGPRHTHISVVGDSW